MSTASTSDPGAVFTRGAMTAGASTVATGSSADGPRRGRDRGLGDTASRPSRSNACGTVCSWSSCASLRTHRRRSARQCRMNLAQAAGVMAACLRIALWTAQSALTCRGDGGLSRRRSATPVRKARRRGRNSRQ